MLYKAKKPMAGVSFIDNGSVKQAITIPNFDNTTKHGAYSPALISDGYGFEDGKMKGPTTNHASNSSAHYDSLTTYSTLYGGGTPFGFSTNNASEVTTNYKLAGDITFYSSNLWDESYIFSGILDGCGHTITIDVSNSGSWSSAHAFGALMGTLKGTIKNVKLVIKFTWQNSNSNSANQFIGGVAGRIVGGTLENVFVQIDYATNESITMGFSGRPAGNGFKMCGGICGQVGDSQNSNPTTTATFTNVTVKIDHIGWKNTAGTSWAQSPDCKFTVAGFVGHVAQNATVTATNCSVKGTGNLYSQTIDGNSGGKTKAHKGAFCGYSQGNITIAYFKYAWTGNTKNYDQNGNEFTLNNNYECSLIGAFDTAGTLSITNFYYSSSSTAKSNGYLEWQDTQTALFGQEFDDSLDPYIGLYNGNLWIGDITQIKVKTCGLGGTDCDGKYIDSLTFTDGTVVLARDIAPSGIARYRGSTLIANSGVLAIAKIAASSLQSMTNVLQTIAYGYYSFVTKEAGSSAGTFKMYYNNGSYTDYSFPQDFNGRVSVYDYLERKVINGQPYFAARDCGYDYYETE